MATPLEQIHSLMSGKEWNADTLQDIADVLTHAGFKMREPFQRTRSTDIPKTPKPKKARRPYVLVSISGGVGEVVRAIGADAEIVDFDNLKELCGLAEEVNKDYLSTRAWNYIKKDSPELYARIFNICTPEALKEWADTLARDKHVEDATSACETVSKRFYFELTTKQGAKLYEMIRERRIANGLK